MEETMSIDRLIEKIDALDNPTVVGLDPAPEHIPPALLARHIAERGETLDALAAAYLEFNRAIIDAVRDIVPAVKPQAAYYERLGSAGFAAFEETAKDAASQGLYVIADVKRNDIGSTATAYAEGYLGSVKIGESQVVPLGFDALTVNGYLGSDGILPFLDCAVRCDKAVFVLVKTSNPSSGELQDLFVNDMRVYEKMGALIENLASGHVGKYGYSPLGAVVGATYPAELTELRGKLPHTFFLVPGYGAQGGAAADVAGAFDENRRGAIINSSRAIIAAWKNTGNNGSDFAEAARAEAIKMREALRSALKSRGTGSVATGK
jgi:orotidine-5'-phosphate decarboxylase